MGKGLRSIGRGIRKTFKPKAPPPIVNSLPSNQAIANQIPPINFVSIFDTLRKEKMDIVRGADGRVTVTYGGDNVPVNIEPINHYETNTTLPAVRPVRNSRNIDERAAAVIVLSQAMSRLSGVIEQMERTSPYLIAENQELINSFKQANMNAIEQGFDFKTHAIDQRLAKMGLSDSSTALGVKIKLASEKAHAIAKLNLDEAQLAQGLKQQSIENLYRRSNQIADNANLELNRYNSETANQLQLREQELQTDLANEQMIQDNAYRGAALNLEANQQDTAVDMFNRQIAQDNRNFADNRQRMALQAGLNMFGEGNSQALGARHIDNTALNDLNRNQLARYSRLSNPWQEALTTAVGSFLGSSGQRLGERFGDRMGDRFLNSNSENSNNNNNSNNSNNSNNNNNRNNRNNRNAETAANVIRIMAAIAGGG